MLKRRLVGAAVVMLAGTVESPHWVVRFDC